MKRKIFAKNLNCPSGATQQNDFDIELPGKCPRCNTGHSSDPISSFYLERNKTERAPALLISTFFCPACEKCFYVEYSADIYNLGPKYAHIIKTLPSPELKTIFSNHIKNLSSGFVKIYNQAEQAEAFGLDEIAGLGYRKAMEFLIKDFAIYKHPDDEEAIKVQPLSQCIRNYISSDEIKTLATRCAWIGNDEAHYIRKQENRDVSDMKNFIAAIVYFISMILITDDAASITPAN